MRTFKVVIIDDDYLSSLEIKLMLDKLEVKIVKILDSRDSILNITNYENIDLILSDVKLGAFTYSYQLLQNLDLSIPIIFYTSYLDMELYEGSTDLNPYMYLVKPINLITLKSAIEGVQRKEIGSLNIENDEDIKIVNNSLFLRSKGKLINIDPLNIIYIESDGNYCHVHMLNKRRLVIRSSMKKVVLKFKRQSFIRTHRAYFINLRMIDEIDIKTNRIKLKNIENHIPIGRKYKSNLNMILAR